MKRLRDILILLAVIAPATVMALKSDRNQPAIIEADEVEMDFRTGKRTYRGNVSVQQGSMRITADELITIYRGEKLAKATAFGNPAVFRQRPDGKDQDVIGKGKRLELDQIKDLITLNENASITQGADVIEGKIIVYSLETEKMTVQGRTTEQKAAVEKIPTESAQAEQPPSQTQTQETPADQARPRLTIQPKSTSTE